MSAQAVTQHHPIVSITTRSVVEHGIKPAHTGHRRARSQCVREVGHNRFGQGVEEGLRLLECHRMYGVSKGLVNSGIAETGVEKSAEC
jgi:hypothetical protein